MAMAPKLGLLTAACNAALPVSGATTNRQQQSLMIAGQRHLSEAGVGTEPGGMRNGRVLQRGTVTVQRPGRFDGAQGRHAVHKATEAIGGVGPSPVIVQQHFWRGKRWRIDKDSNPSDWEALTRQNSHAWARTN